MLWKLCFLKLNLHYVRRVWCIMLTWHCILGEDIFLWTLNNMAYSCVCIFLFMKCDWCTKLWIVYYVHKKESKVLFTTFALKNHGRIKECINRFYNRFNEPHQSTRFLKSELLAFTCPYLRTSQYPNLINMNISVADIGNALLHQYIDLG